VTQDWPTTGPRPSLENRPPRRGVRPIGRGRSSTRATDSLCLLAGFSVGTLTARARTIAVHEYPAQAQQASWRHGPVAAPVRKNQGKTSPATLPTRYRIAARGQRHGHSRAGPRRTQAGRDTGRSRVCCSAPAQQQIVDYWLSDGECCDSVGKAVRR
jgi:hypothetical protein